ncbi:hypothetical protein AURDEDRAFT_115505 [Auricularia subglabra TFB-10046 SS5]|uniref:Uncharacterized protein n=1 Tax=Auricularia subglabra (strain TFB-10046 / SS5) TaxID=717982 RepID=J0DDH0_AURST|nr:hypothetical protein AURDEDRAFT_115505 [Auricularia subglabra TFB-10046 SS5]
MVRNLSIWDASTFTASSQGITIMRAILASCPNIVCLQVSPTICAQNLLAGLRPVPRLYVCDSILDDPFLLGAGNCARSLTHLHVMDLRYFTLWVDTLEPFQDDIAKAFPQLTVFSSTTELEAHGCSARLAAAVRAVLSIPTIERVNIEITCEQGVEYTESPVCRALHDLEDARVYASGAVPRIALLSSIIELARWRSGAIGVDDFWHKGSQVYL